MSPDGPISDGPNREGLWGGGPGVVGQRVGETGSEEVKVWIGN